MRHCSYCGEPIAFSHSCEAMMRASERKFTQADMDAADLAARAPMKCGHPEACRVKEISDREGWNYDGHRTDYCTACRDMDEHASKVLKAAAEHGEFTVDEHTRADKEFEISNGRITLLVKYDDVDYDEVDKELDRVMFLLNGADGERQKRIEEALRALVDHPYPIAQELHGAVKQAKELLQIPLRTEPRKRI